MGKLIGVVAVLATIFGLACLNYTNGFGITHHSEWAAAKGYPAPSYAIFVIGAALAVLGAGAIGFTVARWKRSAEQPMM